MMVDRSARDPGHEPPFLKWWGKDPRVMRPEKNIPSLVIGARRPNVTAFFEIFSKEVKKRVFFPEKTKKDR